MKEYSKYNKTDLIVVIALIVLITVIIMIIYNRNHHVSKYKEQEFLKNLDAYNKLAEIYYEDYKKNNTDSILHYSLIEEDVIHCYSYNYDIELSDEEVEIGQIALKELVAYMTRSSLYDVYVYDTFVSFCEGGKEWIIYSAKDKKPSYIIRTESSSKASIIITKITDHWYEAHINAL
ncbi:MAG: hypothetical protein J6L77_08645 [Coprococcus sp.]|nr:hypothetical protein [Coprococcus sp.]